LETFYEIKIPLNPNQNEKYIEKLLEWEIQQGPLVAEMLWLGEMKEFKGVSLKLIYFIKISILFCDM
jgi:hypothetical protein